MEGVVGERMTWGWKGWLSHLSHLGNSLAVLRDGLVEVTVLEAVGRGLCMKASRFVDKKGGLSTT